MLRRAVEKGFHGSRSREGAWIEILLIVCLPSVKSGRSREGAWIEIKISMRLRPRRMVAPVRERGLKYLT